MPVSDSAIASSRSRSELLGRLDPEDTALAARVHRLEDGGQADCLERCVDVLRRAERGERGLRQSRSR